MIHKVIFFFNKNLSAWSTSAYLPRSCKQLFVRKLRAFGTVSSPRQKNVHLNPKNEKRGLFPDNMKLIVLAAVVAVAAAATIPVTVLVDERVAPAGGAYSTNVQLDNGVSLSETGSPGSLGQTNVQGQYSFVGDDGITYTVFFVANENGYQAQGDHLPVAPPAPAHVAELLRIAEEQRAQGITFE
ncbi:cuticle protein AM1159-like [Oratosquilla oratoria]|uniref:cuticle protein AM1159-like n=1 Tax=Oratosquilla oratoria TaxID=337810 RepID=UPI003F76795E